MPANTLLNITKEELSQLISSAIEQKLLEILGDPEEHLLFREEIQKRLVQQKALVAKGKRGKKLGEVEKRLELK
ncbi:MAG: hypothetical protein Q8K98_09955 [Bacteroidota bacterium]|nr:hypothetical protein [Bacteroidota bacterium]